LSIDARPQITTVNDLRLRPVRQITGVTDRQGQPGPSGIIQNV
jgi:hypothetical protein